MWGKEEVYTGYWREIVYLEVVGVDGSIIQNTYYELMSLWIGFMKTVRNILLHLNVENSSTG